MKAVRILNEDGISRGTKIFDAASGAEIHGVTGIEIKFAPDDMVRAKIDLCGNQVGTKAEASYRLIHPKTGEMTEVRRIEFVDGEILELI